MFKTEEFDENKHSGTVDMASIEKYEKSTVELYKEQKKEFLQQFIL